MHSAMVYGVDGDETDGSDGQLSDAMLKSEVRLPHSLFFLSSEAVVFNDDDSEYEEEAPFNIAHSDSEVSSEPSSMGLNTNRGETRSRPRGSKRGAALSLSDGEELPTRKKKVRWFRFL